MKKLITSLALSLALIASPALAHHPAEDIVDADIWAMIDEMVADTPHADLVFDEMGPDTTTIIADSVEDAQDLIDSGLLTDLSVLDYQLEDVDLEVTITFGEPSTDQVSDDGGNGNGYTDANEWDREVYITINTTPELEQ